MPEQLNKESINGWLRERNGWKRDGHAIRKEFCFPTFRNVRYDKVQLRLYSHDAGGVTERDLALAQAIDHSTSAA